MHGFSFSLLGAALRKPAGPTLPLGTRLSVPTLLNTAAGELDTLTITYSVPVKLSTAALSVAGPAAVQIEGALDQSVATGDGSVTLPIAAPPGYHRLTITLSGTVEGEAVHLTRHTYVIAKPPEDAAEVAAR